MWESNRYWTAAPEQKGRQNEASRHYGRGYSRNRRPNRRGETMRTGRGLIVPEGSTDGNATVELRDESDRIEIYAEFADVSPDRVGVSLIDSEIRIRAKPESSDEAGDAFERRIALTRRVDVEQADVSRSDSTLSVTLPKRTSA